MTSRRIQGPAGCLYVDDGGTGGLPVLFVHSFAGSSAHWSAQLAHLRPNRRAVAFDLRGHGQSDPHARDDYAIGSLAEDVAAVADELNIRRFVMVGHSLGGAVAIAYAGERPGQIAGLLLVGAPGRVPVDQAQQIMTAMEADYEKVTEGYWDKLLKDAQPRLLAQIKSEMRSLPRETALSIIRATFQFDPLPALSAYRGPKLAVVTPHGDTSNDLHKLLPDLPHKLIIGTSHWPHMDKPEEFNQIMDAFLATIGQAQGASR